MHPESHTAPDALLTLTSGPTVTVDADHPGGRDDWIIDIEPGGFHTHPGLLAPTPTMKSWGSSPVSAQAHAAHAFIENILQDRTVLILRTRNGRITQLRPLDPEREPLESAILEAQTDPHAPPDEHTVFRLWSGKILAEIPAPEPRPPPSRPVA